MTRMQRSVKAMTQEDDGLALLLALIFILVVGLVVAAMLPYTSAGLRTASTVSDVRTVQNAADGAVDQAINAIRGSFRLGSSLPGATCPTYTTPNYVPAPNPAVPTIRVTCANAGGTSLPGDAPPYAIQTLAGNVDVQGNAPLQVDGNVFATGKVTTAQPQQSMIVNGDLFATDTCNAAVIVTGVRHCSDTTPAYSTALGDPTGADPFGGDYDALQPGDATNPLPVVPNSSPAQHLAADPVGTCASNQKLVVFTPGYYSETPTPAPGCTGNSNSVWWFRPGLYYFDFPQGAYGLPYTDAMSAWNLGNKSVVAGALKNSWDANTKASDVISALQAGNGACDTDANGATFVFGGPTNITISSLNYLELCPGPVSNTAQTSQQFISLFGWRSGGQRTVTNLWPATPARATNVTSALADFQPAMAAQTSDNVPATTTVSRTGHKTATIHFDTFTPAIPDGSLITAFNVHVRHSETANQVNLSLKLTSDASNSPVTMTVPVNNSATITDDPITPTMPPAQRWRALKNLQIDYTADGSNLPSSSPTATAALDSIELEIAYVPPQLEATRCITPGCQLLTNTVTDRVFLHGTVYTPLANLTVAVHNYSTTVFERGVICAALVATVSPSTKQTDAPFQVPGGSTNRVVLFTAESLEPDGSWRTRVQAKVRYQDFVGTAAGKRTAKPGVVATVLSWTVIR